MVTFHSDHPYMKASYVSERIPAGANPLRLKDRSDTLLSWMGQSKATEQEFATRLQSKGLNLDEFNQLLANKDIPATLHTGWMHDLDSILNQTPESWLTQHVHMGIGVVVLPFLYEYSEQVRRWSSLSTTGKILQEPVLNSLQAGFLRDLRMVADRTSVYMYHLAKEQEPDLTLETYVKRLASGMTEIRKMLEQFPVLARILTEMSLRAANNTIELLERLLNDYDEIATMYFDGKQLRLKSVQTGAGDTHQNGRTVTILEFDSNIKLIYKPRSLDTDLAFAEWLRYLNNKGLRYELKGPLTLSKQQYGWQEFVEHRACQNEAEVRKYYYRMGMLCGILYAFQSTDMHYENIVACGDIPYIIDYETLLANNIYDEEKLDFPMSMLYRSVFLSGLIPVGQVFRSQIDFDLSGIGGKPDQTSTNMKGWVLKQDNTDEVQYVEVPFKTAQLQHLVQLNGQIIEPVRYLAEISEGFREIYQIMANEKETIKREIRERFGKLTGRALLRPTFLYGRFLAASQHPKYLRNGLDREKLLEMLWNIVKVDKRFEQIVPTEIDDLLNNDIPYYTFPIDDTCLYTSDQRKIPNIFKKTCLAWIEEKLDRYSQKDLTNQLHLLQYAIHSAQVEHMALPEMEALDYVESLPLTSSQFDPTATAINIANYLLEYRLTEQGHSTWLGLRNHDNRFRLTLLDFSLYSGTLGISMFLGLMYVQTGNSEYRNAAMENFRYVISVFERVADDELSPSVFNGRGSVVYAGFFLDALFDFPEARQAARLQLTKIKQYSGQPLSAQPVDELQSNLDFLDGYAGIITLCVHIWERFAEPEALETARIYAERLCQHLKQDQAKLVGFAHGSSGMIYALRKIEAYDLLSPDEGVLDTLLQFERSNYDSTRANWMDLRGHVEDRLGSYYWCHGAPGVLLGRSELDEPIDEAERLKLLNAMLEHAASNPRLSLCHGIFGMMEILLSLANNPGWQASSSMIHDAIWGLVNRASVSSQIEGMKDRGLVGLMLGVSGIGWTCLRLANAELPSVMTLQFPAKAVSITEQANPVLAEEGAR
ncbi:type 2 lanthipeptide synthetase LanM [Paenibacillus silvae]|uniref:type 2 lanthipeptide synthetase LanM n=1 Tax=Paenibacillus silvae TaxID=1325358 RepID=UPI003CF40BA6